MDVLVGLVAIAFGLTWLVGSLGVLFVRGRRRSSAVVATIGLVGGLSAAAFGISLDNQAAQARGFISRADELMAQERGVTDPELWAEKRGAVLAVKAEEEAAAKRLRDEQRERDRAAKTAAEAVERQKEADEASTKANACRSDLACWGEKALIIAGIRCAPEVERMAQYDVEWSDGFLGQKFTHFRWADEKAGTVTTLGDKVQFGNAFGAKVTMTYECEVNPATRDYSDVRVYPGRL